ncbi:MAG: glucose-6-phosphate dehydrogenase [Chloroflexota bacterium]|nr:glucose-6-phosphate dehydrogenase [Chloroflexota bacterium]MDE3192536.1 glucose-6-phosphate dehydrogenase [Chloroflexota bacterium]
MVIFGGTGDLASRKLLPALYDLARQRLLPQAFCVVGVGRADMTDAGYRQHLHDAVAEHSRSRPIDEDVWSSFAERLFYVSVKEDQGYDDLKRRLADLDGELGTDGDRLFYLATPPAAYASIVRSLGRHELAHNGTSWSRIVVEKPFGRDLESARSLSQALHEVFAEDEIFRIDHYLGKETVQNILVLRYANSIFEPVWNRRYVDHVQITVAESLGVEERTEYYDRAGAMRDVVQNHLLQLFALVAMEPPAAFDANAVRDEKVKALRAIRKTTTADVGDRAVRGQYAAGFIEGEPVTGYHDLAEVPPESHTETFVALKLFVDNWRWEGTPFYLRHGKRLPKRSTEIAIRFRSVPHQLFSEEQREGLEPNTLVLRIQPEEGISLKFGAKVPVQGVRIRSVAMDFVYGASFLVDAPDAYETLLLDALRGDATLFTRQDEVEEQWRLVDPILEAWRAAPDAPPSYAAGSWGPTEADAFIERDGRRWRQP